MVYPYTMSNAKRPETGAMKFGDDWTGTFLRGDDAIPYAMSLDQVLDFIEKDAAPEVQIQVTVLRGLADTLRSSNEIISPKGQIMRPFEDCLPKKEAACPVCKHPWFHYTYCANR
jgi:hypothetical protein